MTCDISLKIKGANTGEVLGIARSNKCDTSEGIPFSMIIFFSTVTTS